MKKQSSLGRHCDQKYHKCGNYSTSNTQKFNIPVVIVTIGKQRSLNWRRRYLALNIKGRSIWKIDDFGIKVWYY